MATWIDQQEQLAALAARLADQRVIAVDAESNSYFVYRGRLCLLQISTADEDLLIDTLADLDFSPLAAVMADANCIKIFHDAEQDIPAMKGDLGLSVQGLFDTRVAAGALGESKQGLASQLQKFLGVEVDKGQQLSDWGQRPLSEAQLKYAAADTQHLVALQRAQQEALAQRPALVQSLFARECRRFEALEPRDLTPDPEAYFHLKGAGRLNPKALAFLRALHAAREARAQALDQPAARLFPSRLLPIIADRAGQKGPPQQVAQLGDVGLSKAQVKRHGAWILRSLQDAQDHPPVDLKALRDSTRHKILDQQAGERLLRLKKWRQNQAQGLGLDPSLLLLSEDLKAIAEQAPRSLSQLAAMPGCDAGFVSAFGDALLAFLWSA